ncbi:MAG: hypothetical protein JJE25_02505 [Bacteroidia bacterium]|nr:hypothetical protein [Bacteroidia bacterium]
MFSIQNARLLVQEMLKRINIPPHRSGGMYHSKSACIFIFSYPLSIHQSHDAKSGAVFQLLQKTM